MPDKYRTEDELEAIAREVVDTLRPKHLTIGQIRKVLRIIDEALEYVVLREKIAEK